MVAYGISINLVEVTWKSKIKQQFPNPNDYSAFMGDFSSATGEAACEHAPCVPHGVMPIFYGGESWDWIKL